MSSHWLWGGREPAGGRMECDKGAGRIAARVLAEQPPEVVAAATDSIREALTPFLKGQSVALSAAIWIVTARA